MAAKEKHQRQTAALFAEKATIEKSLREQARAVAGLFGQPNAAARLAEIEALISAGETRLAAIAAEIAGLGDQKIDDTDVTAALQNFTGVTGALSPSERERLIHLLVERVTYNA